MKKYDREPQQEKNLSYGTGEMYKKLQLIVSRQKAEFESGS